MGYPQVGKRDRRTDEATRERAECPRENGEALSGGCPVYMRACERTGVDVWSSEAVREVGLRCGEDVDDEVCWGWARRRRQSGAGVGVERGCHSGGDAEGEGDEGEGVECDGGERGEGRAVECGRASCAVGEARGDDGDGLGGLAEELTEACTGVVGGRVDASARKTEHGLHKG